MADRSGHLRMTLKDEARMRPFHGQPVAMKSGSTLSYLQHDHLGSLVSASDANGTELGWQRSWPFGQVRLSGGSLPTDRLFTGQTRDLNNDAFYFFKSRYYDATIGQFHTPDLAVPRYAKGGPNDPQALNRYAYALNNPLRAIDRTGQQATDTTSSDTSTAVTFFIGGIGGSGDPTYAAFIQWLQQYLPDVQGPEPAYGARGPFGLVTDFGVAAERATGRVTDPDAMALAQLVGSELASGRIKPGERINFIGYSGGASVAFDAATLLQAQHVQIANIVTLGGFVLHGKPANVGRWTAIVGSGDPIGMGGLLGTAGSGFLNPGALRSSGLPEPDRLVLLPGFGHYPGPGPAVVRSPAYFNDPNSRSPFVVNPYATPEWRTVQAVLDALRD